jgi:hypothetical protein
MSQLAHLQDKLQNVGATLAKLEMAIALHPEEHGLLANYKSLQRLHSSLQDDFSREADHLGMDVTHYRLTDSRPSARALSGSVGRFQDAISVAYEAIAFGRRNRRSISVTALAETALEVAYSYPGSFGVVFTVPNQRLLIPDMQSKLDQAIETVLEVGKARDSKQVVSDVEQRLGRATIVAVHDWATTNAEFRLGTDIEWRRNADVRRSVMIQAPEFDALAKSLERMAESREELMAVRGVLVGADIKSHRFHFVAAATDDDFRGRFTDAISETQIAQLPGKYTANIKKTTATTYATGEEDITYFLQSLEPPK